MFYAISGFPLWISRGDNNRQYTWLRCWLYSIDRVAEAKRLLRPIQDVPTVPKTFLFATSALKPVLKHER